MSFGTVIKREGARNILFIELINKENKLFPNKSLEKIKTTINCDETVCQILERGSAKFHTEIVHKNSIKLVKTKGKKGRQEILQQIHKNGYKIVKRVRNG